MKIILCLTKNQNLAQKFPHDPDYDLTIICGDLKFKLQIAFLYLESMYFDDVEQQNKKEIQLDILDEQALSNVLLVLYGGEVEIKSINQLSKVFNVITHLKIQSLKQLVIDQLKQNLQNLNSIELLQFCYQHNVLINQISSMNMSNDLQILRDPKYSMQLNKISSKSLNIVLLDYYNKCHNSQNEQIIKSNINSILGDYFHNNKIKPEQYFTNYNVELLQYIWFQFHPVYYTQTLYGSNNSNKSQQMRKIQQNQNKIKQYKLTIQKQQKRIKDLTQQNLQIQERLKKRKTRIGINNYLSIPRSEVITKPPVIPISPTSNHNMNLNFNLNQNSNHNILRTDYLIQDDQYHSHKQMNMNQMKAKQGINRIHTRNYSRGKE